MAKMADLKVGNGMDEGVTIGPLIKEGAAENVHRLVTSAIEQGATLKVGGEWKAGSFYPPTLLDNVSTNMDIVNEEIFGPVVTIMTFKTDDEAAKLANDTPFGLASYFYSQNISRIHRFSDALQFGMVGINTSKMTGAPIPFGGVKQSGLGREGGPYGMHDFMEYKYVCSAYE